MSDLATTDEAVIEGWCIRAPERSYDFEQFSDYPRITSIAMRLLIDKRSSNEDVLTRKATNGNTYKAICAFLKFCMHRSDGSGQDELLPDLLHAYIEHQEKHHSELTAFHTIWQVKRLYEFAFQEGSAASFSIPRSRPQAAIKLAQKPAPTLAGSVADLPAGVGDRTALDRLLIERLHDYCWLRIHQIRERYALALRWRDEPHDVGTKRSWKKRLP